MERISNEEIRNVLQIFSLIKRFLALGLSKQTDVKFMTNRFTNIIKNVDPLNEDIWHMKGE
jgi:hypothetical protein